MGRAATLASLNGMYFMEYNDGKIEDSLVFPYTPPTLLGITANGLNPATGNVLFNLNNILATNGGSTVTLSIVDVTKVQSRGDTSSAYGNCATPNIYHINTVAPNSSGNIDLYGIEPVEVHVAGGTITVNTGSLTLDQLCTKSTTNLPPTGTATVGTPPNDTTFDYTADKYIATKPYTTLTPASPPNIVDTEQEEWRDWPQYL